MKPITVDAGEAAQWFDYEGKGIQYDSPGRVIDLIKEDSLKRR
jgi:hypothetical protein